MRFARWMVTLAAAGLLLTAAGCQKDAPLVTGEKNDKVEKPKVPEKPAGRLEGPSPAVADVALRKDVVEGRGGAEGRLEGPSPAVADVVSRKDVVERRDVVPARADVPVTMVDVPKAADVPKAVDVPVAVDVPKAVDVSVARTDVSVDVAAAAGPVIDQERSRKVFDEATKLIKDNKLDKATRLLEEWLKLTPMDLVNRRNIIHIYMKLEKLEEAELHLKFMSQALAGEVEWWLHLGRVQARLGKYAQSLESLEKALELEPRNLDIALDLARTHSKRSDWESARKVLDKAMVQGKRMADFLRELAPVLVNLGEYNKAFESYRRLQRLEPTYEIALVMAQVAARNERCPDVVDSLVGWDKDFVDETPYLLLGSCAQKSEDPDTAEKHFALGLKANKKCFNCALWLGDIYFGREDWVKAISYYGTAVPLKPQDYRPFNQLGKALANSEMHIEAMRASAKANERKPSDPEIVYMYGVEAVRAGQKGDAWKIWGQLEDLDKGLAVKLKLMLTE